VRFRKDRPTTGKASRNASPASASARSALEGADAELFEALRVARLAIAKELSVPPYVVFPDTTLVAFATERPTSRDALLGISGVGQSKLECYGDAFLTVIRAHHR
jgi:ATP-dependent DNA helicase RecQ